MKIATAIKRSKKDSRGSILIAVLAILAITFILFTMNSKTLLRLSREVDALDKRQTNRLATISAQQSLAAQTE